MAGSPADMQPRSPLPMRAHGKPRRDEPEWLRRNEDDRPASMAAADGDVCVTLQDDRPDGFDLLTARYTLHETGALKTYAGAGLNRARLLPGTRSPTTLRRERSEARWRWSEPGWTRF